MRDPLQSYFLVKLFHHDRKEYLTICMYIQCMDTYKTRYIQGIQRVCTTIRIYNYHHTAATVDTPSHTPIRSITLTCRFSHKKRLGAIISDNGPYNFQNISKFMFQFARGCYGASHLWWMGGILELDFLQIMGEL